MFESILGLLTAVVKLGVLSVEERHKYEDNILKVKREWYEEYSKPSNEISDVRLVELERELRLLTDAVINSLGAAGSKN